MATIPILQNNPTPINLGSAIPSLSSIGSTLVQSALPKLGAVSPLYDRVMSQLGGGHVFRLQRDGVTFATGILESDIGMQLDASYNQSATGALVSGAANEAGNAVTKGANVLAAKSGSKVVSAVARVAGGVAGKLTGKLLSANKAASAVAWDFSNGNYWRQTLKFTLIRVGTAGETDVLARFYALAESVASHESGGVFTGPYGMAVDGQLFDGSLGISLLVGNWLTIDDLVVTQLISNFSRVITVDNLPYMAGISMTIQTRTAISHNVDLKRYLNQ